MRARKESNLLREFWRLACCLSSDPWRPRRESNPPRTVDSGPASPDAYGASCLLARSWTEVTAFRKRAPASGGTRRWGVVRVTIPSVTDSQSAWFACSITTPHSQRSGNPTPSSPAQTERASTTRIAGGSTRYCAGLSRVSNERYHLVSCRAASCTVPGSNRAMGRIERPTAPPGANGALVSRTGFEPVCRD